MQPINIFALFFPNSKHGCLIANFDGLLLEQRDYLISSDETDVTSHSMLFLYPCSITLHVPGDEMRMAEDMNKNVFYCSTKPECQ